MNAVLKTDNLAKKFGSIQALIACNLTFNEGEIWGILGPNGSGKSTLLGTVLDALRSSGGSYNWFEGRQENFKLNIGSLLESPKFYPYLNAVDNLKIIAKIKNTDTQDIPHLLELVGLYSRRNSTFKTYSLGMKQRLGIAATLIGDPNVLILDEPTNGLDPEGIREIRDLIIQLGKKGKTILMASHILGEVEKVCSHVAILKKGKILKSGRVGQLLEPKKTIILTSDNPLLKDVLSIYSGVSKLTIEEHKYIFEVKINFELEPLCSYIQQQGILLTGIEEKKTTLEEEFIQITQ